jgi:hypothetical protein
MADLFVREGGAGGAYASLNAAFTAAGLGDTIRIQDAWTTDDTTSISTSASDVTVIAEGESRCSGVYEASPSHYRHRYAGGSGHAMNFTMASGNRSVTFDGVEIIRVGGSASDECIRLAGGASQNGSKLFFNDGLMGFTVPTDQQDCVYVQSANEIEWHFENSVFINVYRGVAGCFAGLGPLLAEFNSCHAYNISHSGLQQDGSGLVGWRAGNTATGLVINIFNTLVECVAGFPINTDTAGSQARHTIQINDSITDWTEWFNWGDDSSDITITNSPVSGEWKTAAGAGATEVLILDDTGLYDLRLLDDAANNDAQDFHSNASGAGLNMPATDLVGTTRAAPYECGPFSISVAAGPDITDVNTDETVVNASGGNVMTGTSLDLVTGLQVVDSNGALSTLSTYTIDSPTQITFTMSDMIAGNLKFGAATIEALSGGAAPLLQDFYTGNDSDPMNGRVPSANGGTGDTAWEDPFGYGSILSNELSVTIANESFIWIDAQEFVKSEADFTTKVTNAQLGTFVRLSDQTSFIMGVWDAPDLQIWTKEGGSYAQRASVGDGGAALPVTVTTEIATDNNVTVTMGGISVGWAAGTILAGNIGTGVYSYLGYTANEYRVLDNS